LVETDDDDDDDDDGGGDAVVAASEDGIRHLSVVSLVVMDTSVYGDLYFGFKVSPGMIEITI
jgi:hypothetical protein